MLIIGLLIVTATAEPKKVSYIDFEAIDLTGTTPQPALVLVVEKRRPVFKPLTQLYIIEPNKRIRNVSSVDEVPPLGMQLDAK